MGKIYEFAGLTPVIDPSAFVHPDAVIIGDVIIGPNCYIGPCACLRGDFSRIRLGAGVNVQDNSVLHSFPNVDLIVEDDGHVGHGAVLHGCIIKRNALIGMNAVVMDNSVIGENSFVAAMAFVKSGMHVGPNLLVAGIPAKFVRLLTKEDLRRKATGTSDYQILAAHSRASMKEVIPLVTVEPNRERFSVK